MKDIESTHKFMKNVLIFVGTIPTFLVLVVNFAFYKHEIDIPSVLLTTTYISSGSFLYMCYEYFKTERMIEALESRMKEIGEKQEEVSDIQIN